MKRYVDSMSDRKDNEGDYTFDNCQFIELRENIQKRGSTR